MDFCLKCQDPNDCISRASTDGNDCLSTRVCKQYASFHPFNCICSYICTCVRINEHGQLHEYLLVQHPHVCYFSLVLVVQPPELLAGLFHVVVLPDQLDVVLSNHQQFFFQLGVLAGHAAVQRTEGENTATTIKTRLRALPDVLKISIIKIELNLKKKLLCSQSLD